MLFNKKLLTTCSVAAMAMVSSAAIANAADISTAETTTQATNTILGGYNIITGGSVDVANSGGSAIQFNDGGVATNNVLVLTAGTVSADDSDAVSIEQNSTSITVNAGTSIIGSEEGGNADAIGASGNFTIDTITIDGTVTNSGGSGAAINLTTVSSGTTTINVGATGDVVGAITLGTNTNVITNAGTTDAITSAGAGDDTLSNSGTIDGAIDLGDGNNTINITGAGTASATSTITTGSGTDNLNIALTGASDTFTSAGVVDLGTGTNTVNVDSGTLSIGHDFTNVTTFELDADTTVTVTAGTVSGAINQATTGTQTLNLNGGTISGAIDLGDGDDTVTLGGATLASTVAGGAGTGDVLNVTAATSTAGNISGFETINVSDTFTVGHDVADATTTTLTAAELNLTTGTYAGAIAGSAGIETLDVDGGTLAGAINLGAGNDVYEVATGTIGNITEDAGGDDSYDVDSGVVGTITDATGADTYDVAGGTVDAVADAAGDDSYTISGGTVASIADTAGSDTYVLSGGGTAITSGITDSAGNDTYTIADQAFTITDNGSSDDTYNINFAGGLANITDDGGTDTVALGVNTTTAAATDFDGFETVKVNSGTTLTVGHDVAATTVMVDGGELNLTAGTIAGNVTGGTGSDTLDVDGGTISGTIGLGDGDDTYEFATTTLNAITDSAGAADTLTLDGSTVTTTTSGAISGIETITVGAGNTFSVGHDVSGVTSGVALGAASNLTVTAGTLTGDVTGDGSVNTLTVSGGGITGDIDLAGDADVAVLSGGTITGALDLGAGADTLTLSGATVTGAIDAGADNDTININSNLTLNATTSLVNAEDIVLGNNATLMLASTLASDFAAATLNNAAGTTANIYKNATFSGAVTHAGTVTINDDAVLTAASLTSAANSALNIDLKYASSTLSGGTIVSAGGVDLTNATITFTVDSASEAIANGSTLLLVDGGAASTAGTINDTSFLYDFALDDTTVDGGNDIQLTVTAANTVASAAEGTTSNALASTVDGFSAANGDSADLISFKNSLASVSSASGIQDKLDELSGGSTQSGAAAASMGTQTAALNVVSGRIGDVSAGTGVSSGDHGMHKSVWLKGFGNVGEADARDGVAGYESTTAGIAVGVDSQEIIDGALVGVALSYAATEVEDDSAANGQTDIDSYQLTVYSSFDLGDQVFLNGLVSAAMNENESTRTVSSSTAVGDYDSSQYSAKVEVGRGYEYEGMILTPSASLQYTYLDIDGYTETGAGAFNQTVEATEVEALLFGLGGSVAWNIAHEDMVLVPSLRARYFYDFIGDEYETTSSFTGGGASFTQAGADAQQGSLNLGASLDVMATDAFSLSLDYDADIKSDYVGHSGAVTARWKF